jgi:hypothetical protein
LIGGSLNRKAEAYMEQAGYGNIPEEVARANARLIAAAPELLGVCKGVIRLSELLTHYFKTAHPTETKAVASLISNARAAIAKVEG